MKKLFSLMLLMLFAIPFSSTAVSKLAKALRQRQTQLFHTDSIEAFIDVSERLKTVLQNADEDIPLYDAWAYQVTYLLDNVSDSEAMRVIDEMRDYAEKHKSKYGFYLATFLNAHLAYDLGMKERAEELVQQALDYKRSYLPNLKPPLQLYYFLTSVYRDKKQGEKSIVALDSALQYKGWSGEEQVVLWSLKCNAVCYTESIDTARFMKYYKQLHAVISQNDYKGGAALSTECYHAQLTHNYSQLLNLAQNLRDKADRLRFKIAAYDGLDRNQEAIDSFRIFKDWTDRQYNAETRKLAELSALQLESARAENEAATLRLLNQRMLLSAVACGLSLLVVFLIVYLRRRQRQMRQLREAYRQLEAVTTQKERMESELRIARDIQLSMLPADFLQYPDVDVCASMVPAKAVGGDLYDYFLLGRQLWFCIGDVSGKGVPAALFMTVTKSLFRAYASEETMPDVIVSRMNANLSEGNKRSMFVTLFVGILDLTSGQLHYCNAGHEDPLVLGTDIRLLPCERRFPVGAVRATVYTTQTVLLPPGATLFLYTDGLSESKNVAGEQFGLKRITDEATSAVHSHQHDPRALIDRMAQSANVFAGHTEQSDDITMLAIARSGEKSSKKSREVVER